MAWTKYCTHANTATTLRWSYLPHPRKNNPPEPTTPPRLRLNRIRNRPHRSPVKGKVAIQEGGVGPIRNNHGAPPLEWIGLHVVTIVVESLVVLEVAVGRGQPWGGVDRQEIVETGTDRLYEMSRRRRRQRRLLRVEKRGGGGGSHASWRKNAGMEGWKWPTPARPQQDQTL